MNCEPGLSRISLQLLQSNNTVIHVGGVCFIRIKIHDIRLNLKPASLKQTLKFDKHSVPRLHDKVVINDVAYDKVRLVTTQNNKLA